MADRKHKAIKNDPYYSAFLDEDMSDSKTMVFFHEQHTHKIIVKLTNQGHTYRDISYEKLGE